MALLTTPTNDQLTDMRSDANYRALQFVCLVPNTVVVRFQPAAAPNTDVYAEISVGTVGTGSMSNIKAGMLVIFSTSTDHQATETFRTRVRKVSGTSILYVAENSQGLTTSDYVTVIDTYEIVERLRNSETYMDWEQAFRLLLPIETALATAYVLSNDAVTWSETAVPKAMDASASSSFTHSWASSNSNDTLDSGGTTATPSFTLEAGAFRWLRYTFTDSNGNSNYRVMAVWTVPKDYSSVVELGFVGTDGDVADISYDAELGWSATVPAWTGIDTVLNKTLCVVASDEWYNNTRQSIRTNIDMVGWLQTEATTTQGSDAAGQTSETRFTIEGIGHQLARQNIASMRITRTTGTPTAWGEIQNPTPARMLTMLLTEESTVLNLCSLSIPSDDTDFIGDDLTVSSTKAMEAINFITEVINAELQFDVNGKLDLCRNLNYLDDTARDAASVIITLTSSDILSVSYDTDHGKTVSQLTLNGGAFNTTTGEYDLFEAIAPAVARESEGDPLAIPNQVLTTDNTEAESIAEAQQRAANLFAANNPTTMMRLTLKPEFHWLIPDIGSWIKVTVAASATARGKAFGSSDRWQMVEYSLSSNSEDGTRTFNVSLRHETRSTGAMVRAAPVIITNEVTQVFAPATTLPFSGLPTLDGLFYDSLDTQPPGNQNPPDDPACELGGFRIKSVLGYETGTVALNGEQVSVTTRGAGKLTSAATYTDDMTSALGVKTYQVSGALPYSPWVGCASGDGPNGGAYNASGGRTGGGCIEGEIVCTTGNGINTADVVVDLGAEYTVSEVSYWWKNTPTAASLVGITVIFRDESGTVLASSGIYAGAGSTTYQQATWSGSQAGVRYVVYHADCPKTHVSYIDDLSVTYGGAGGDTYGDSYYYWTGTLDEPDNSPAAYGAGDGLLIETAQPSSIPPYTPTHEYTVYEIVTSGPVSLAFNSPYALSGADNWSIQSIVCFGGVP